MIEPAQVAGRPGRDGPPLPARLQKARRVLSAIGIVELVLAIVGLVVVTVISGAQAFMRYTNLGSLWWAQEVAQLTITVTYFFGVSFVFKARQYILIEFVSVKFPIRFQLFLYALAQVLTIAFVTTVLILFLRFAPMLLQISTPSLGLPEVLRSVPLAIACAMMILTSVYYLAFGLWALAAGIDGADLHEIERMALVSTIPADPDLV